MKKRQPPKKPKNIRKKRLNTRIIQSALIMRLGFQQIEMIKAQPLKHTALKSLEVAKQILSISEAVQKIFSPKTKYLERINKKKEVMKTSELRVGNIIKNKNNLCTVDGILNDTDLFVSNDFEEWYPDIEDYTPIILTEEWLLKLGVKKYQNIRFISLSNLKAELHFDLCGNVFVPIIKSQFGELILDELKYVHNFQNLYFSLTNNELTIK
jgi:hypothetical protein